MDPMTSEYHFDTRLVRRNLTKNLITRDQVKKHVEKLPDASARAEPLDVTVQWGAAREKLLVRALREAAEAASEESSRREAEDAARLEEMGETEEREFPDVEEALAEVGEAVFDPHEGEAGSDDVGATKG